MNQPIIFVPDHVALLAKQKGFDEPCLTTYFNKELCNPANVEEEHSYEEFLEHVDDDFWCKNSEFSFDTIPDRAAAPTYQQLVDWLREKHNTVIYVRPYLSGLGNTEYLGIVHGIGEYLTEFPVKLGYYEAFDYTLERVLKEI